MTTEKWGVALSAFALGFTVYYAIAFEFNCCYLPAFTYYPAVNDFVPGFATGNDEIGPPMHWYGWLVNSFLVGALVAALALFLPAKPLEKFWGTVAWGAPFAGMLYMIYADRVFFFPPTVP
jgi:hypothetical protein